jgi:hypothetical protein
MAASLSKSPYVPHGTDVSCDTTICKQDLEWRKKNLIIGSRGGNTANGDCFIKNYHEFKRLTAEGYQHLHYAIIQIHYRKTKNSIVHAVVYDGDVIHDVSQGNTLRGDRWGWENQVGCPYDILKYRIWNKGNIPSLDKILDGWLVFHSSWGEGTMTRGSLPKLKGRWDVAAALVC